MISDMGAESNEWRVLSLSAPWPWVILHGAKTIENRRQRWKYRGNVLLHGSLSYDKKAAAFLLERAPELIQYESELYRGKVFARCRIVDVVEPGEFVMVSRELSEQLRKWHIPGQFAYVLEDIHPTPLVPALGALGLWRPPRDVLAAALAEPCPNHPNVTRYFIPEGDCWEACAICFNST